MCPSKVPKAFSSMEEYNAFFKRNQREKLLEEANQAIAWGYADNEFTGYSAGQFISVIRQLRNFIEQNVP
jgi:hypothetical protein